MKFLKKLFLSEKKKKAIKQAKKLVGFGPETLQHVLLAKNLIELLDAHKLAWSRGYRNKNLGPCEYGMFRTYSIPDMTPDEVYLGNIYGLWTFNIRYWNQHCDETLCDNIKCYDLVVGQYRRLLVSNIEEIIKDSKKLINEYE